MDAAAVPIVAERDPALDGLRIQAALTAERLFRAGLPTVAAVLEPDPTREPDGATASPASTWPAADVESAMDETPAIVRILRGDHRALIATVRTLAGDDEAQRSPWQAGVMSMAEAIVGRAIAEGCLDFPVGNPFWDTFTIEQCRLIAGALAVSGYRFDGVSQWEDGRVPGYRELTAAVAGAGLEPRRIRAWPTQDEIAGLYAEVSVAADDYLQEHAPGLDLEEVQDIVAIGGTERARLWAEWDRVRPILMGAVSTG